MYVVLFSRLLEIDFLLLQEVAKKGVAGFLEEDEEAIRA